MWFGAHYLLGICAVTEGHVYFCRVSFLSLFIPPRWYQVSRTPALYEKLGVKTVRKLVQDGDWVRSVTTKKQSAQPLARNRAQIIKYLKTVRMYEGYHVFCFLFFTLSAIHAFSRQLVNWGLMILLSDIIYNVWPMLLQQYTRIRIRGKM